MSAARDLSPSTNGVVKLPHPGTLRRRILEMLPATNREICAALDMLNFEVPRTMARMRDRGLTRRIDGASGRGSKATYARTVAAEAALRRGLSA